MFGQPVNMPGLVEIAKRHGLVVVEDCGQAHGSRIEGRLVGTFGDIGTYSLAARKHVTTGGQGGINILDNAEWASRMRTLVHHGKVGRYDFVTFAENYQITEVQAALGLVSFRQLDEEIARYRRNAAELKRRLTGINLEFDVELPGCFHSRFKVAFLLPKEYGRLRNWFSRALTAEGAPNMYYPLLTDIEWMRKYPYRDGECLVATDVCSRLITIPTALEEDLIVDVAEAVAKVSSCLDIAMAEVPCD
jgi:perosamine synthetase